ncbi:MAG: capsular biosynthesis protein [Gammaproteobacteria bacterium]|nr:capsular biosynthesis protein [Gammaproteobacteria bacterium]MDH3415331.1 capsular biosynthesis protein [Gammaproteobacteria bacterium]
MIDLHCHLLPGIDDGANTLAESLDMARIAVGNGIDRAVMTPHLHPGRYENTRSSIEQPLREFRAALRREQIALEISVAAEVRLSPEILPLLEQDELPFLGEMAGYRIMLLEFPHSHIPLGADNLIKKLLARKIRPIIAHPERNKDVIRDLAKIQPFIDMGCLLQLTASAVAGRFGEGPHLRARQLLELGVVFALATDAHNLKGRRPELREGMQAAAEIVGERAAHAMVYKNPRAILGPRHVAPR